MSNMKAIALQGAFSSPAFGIQEFEMPRPGANDVVVRVLATSINPKDWKLNYNLARAALASPVAIPKPLFGDDLAGVVVHVGSGIKDLKIGDHVYGMDMRLRTAAMAQYTKISRKRIALIPHGMEPKQAAALPLAAQTALQGLRLCGVAKGTRLLINGASGGVGVFAVQMAREMGAHITAVCSHRNAEFVKRLGAHEIIDYTVTPIPNIKQQFDAVFEVTGHLTMAQCLHLLTPQAMFVSTMGSPKTLLANLIARDKRDKKVVVESYSSDLNQINDWFTKGKLEVIIDSVFSHNEVGEAYARSQSGRARGKIVVDMSQM